MLENEKSFFIKMMVPSNLLDYNNNNFSSNKKRSVLIKLKSKICLHFYLPTDTSYGELMKTVKNSLLNASHENFKKSLCKNKLELPENSVTEFYSTGKIHVNYHDSVVFVIDKDKCIYYTVCFFYI